MEVTSKKYRSDIFCIKCNTFRPAESAVRIFETGFRQVNRINIPLGICSAHPRTENHLRLACSNFKEKSYSD